MLPHLRRSIPLLLAIPVLGASSATTAAGAQAAPISVSAVGATLRERQRIRVHTADGTRAYGLLLARTPDSLVLSAPTLRGQRTVAWASVDTLWVQYGTEAVPMGRAVAGMLGATSGLLAYALTGGDYGAPCRAECLVGTVVTGAGVGFVLGAAFGSLLPRWRRVSPAP